MPGTLSAPTFPVLAVSDVGRIMLDSAFVVGSAPSSGVGLSPPGTGGGTRVPERKPVGAFHTGYADSAQHAKRPCGHLGALRNNLAVAAGPFFWCHLPLLSDGLLIRIVVTALGRSSGLFGGLFQAAACFLASWRSGRRHWIRRS